MDDEHLIQGPPSKEQVAEKAELLAGVFKQLIALNASGIGLIVFFADRLDAGYWLSDTLLAFAPLAFLASLLASFLLFFLMTIMQKPSEGDRLFQEFDQLAMFWVAFMGFVLGVLSLAMLAWLNFVGTLHPLIPGVCGIVMITYSGYVLGKRIKKRQQLTRSTRD